MLVGFCNIHAAILMAVASCCWRNGSDQVMFNITHCRLFMKMMRTVKLWVYFRQNRFGLCFRQGWSTKLHTHKHSGTRILTQTHTHTRQCTGVPTPPMFLSSIVTVCVTDLISPTICWLEAPRRRSYPAWQLQTASVYACFSQGLTQYGKVESPSWPPNLHPHTPTSVEGGHVLSLVRAVAPIL